MLFGKNNPYEQARATKLGKGSLPRPLSDLRSWVIEKYNVNVVHVVYDKIDIGPHEGRPRLNLILETTQDYAKMYTAPFTPKPDISKAILTEFSAIVSSQHSGEYDTTNIHLIFDDFSNEAMSQAVSRFHERDKKKILAEFAQDSVWDISGHSKSIVVFYRTDKDVRNGINDGRSARITQRCYELVKQYDEFNYFELETFPIIFDSKQNLDDNYKGSTFYYFR